MQFEPLAKGYANLWRTMVVKPEYKAVSEAISERLFSHKKRYDIVASATGVPWWWIAIVHQLESSGNFSTHLHNGDPLTARTRQVPKGRPKDGNPPFSWEASAADALALKGLIGKPKAWWTIPRALFEFERYNGFGYFGKIASPYVWSFSTHYDKGKITRDHGPIEPVVSKQCGAATLLYCLAKAGHLEKETTMKELSDLLGIFDRVAPLAAQAILGPAGPLVVNMLGKALGVDASPGEIKNAIEADPEKAISILAKIDAALAPIIAPPIATPIASQPEPDPKRDPAPMTGIDAILGGEALKGKKTILGVVAMVAVSAAYNMNWISHEVLTPDLYNVVLTALQGVVGLSIYSAIQRGKGVFGWK